MAWCLMPNLVKDFKRALKSGEIDPAKLAGMESAERRAFLAKYVGEENAVQVNTLFESKLLLKNQKAGMISWAKRVAGISQPAKMDMISRIERLDKALSESEQKAFLQDLASSRLRIDVTSEEAQNIFDLTHKAQELKKKANEEGIFPSDEERLAFGFAKVNLENYVNDLKIQSRRLSFRETPVKRIAQIGTQIPGAIKSAVASFDNSFWGRQGIKTLLDVRTAKYWGKNFLKSWADIGKQLVAKGKIWKSGDDAVMDSIKADIYSRPNALNGKYDAGDYGVHVFAEEAYPSAIPEKIPLLGRVFKASEVAYNGGALRLRADLADRIIAIAEKNGVNTLNREEAQGLGQYVSSMTGRGSNYARLTGEQQAGVNVLLFSVKFLQSNIDTLTAHQFDKKATPFVKKEARKALGMIVASLITIKTITDLINPDSVEIDPRGTNFCKLKIFGHWVDTSGGMASLVTLVSRLMPTFHNGKLSFWTKSSAGNWTDLLAGKYGQQTALDVLQNFIEGKLSPFAGIIRDIWKGENFDGEPVSYKNMIGNYMTPLSIQNFNDLKDDPATSTIFGSMLLDILGLSTSTYRYKANWGESTSKEMLQFKEKLGEEEFQKANDDFNRAYAEWFERISTTPEYKNLSDDGKDALNTKARTEIKEQVFREYGFRYKKSGETPEQKEEKNTIQDLLP